MKERVAKSYDTFANKLVEFSRARGHQSWLIFLFILTVILVTITPFPSHSQLPSSDRLPQDSLQICQADNPKELRGVWLTNIDSDVLFSSEKTQNAIALLAESNFNTLYPTVWNWGYTLYPSAVAQKITGYEIDPTEGLQNRDVLQEMIETGHKQEMAVIPWFEFGFMAPADSELARRYPQWLNRREDGSTIWWEGNVYQRVWLNPLNPEVQQFITDLVVEIVSKYDIDGIQLDDHFGYPAEFGYDEYTVELYKQEHNGASPPSDIKNPEWIRWRADKITAYVETLFQTIKRYNPNAIVSVSPNPQEFSLNSFLLDWYKWERMGLIEELVVQIYRDRQDSFIGELKKAEIVAASKNIPVAIGILSGLKGRNVLIDRIEQQVNTTRELNFAGVSFFFYESLWNLAAESPQQRQAAFKNLFNPRVERPSSSDCQFSQN